MPNLIQQLERRKKSLDSFFSSKKLIQRVKDSGRSKVKIKKDDSGFTKSQLKKNEQVHKKFDPTSGIGPLSYLGNILLGGNQASGEEDQYWRAYLGLSNKLPIANRRDLTEWDYSDEKNNNKHSDFYGITPKMKYYIQAMADSTNLGKLVRSGHGQYNDMYQFSKRLLNNPGVWQQANDEDFNDWAKRGTALQNQGEWNPLGMLAKFGAKWDPEQQRIFVHDTYDFPWYTKSQIPKRPNEMKIRGSEWFSPYIGSDFFRNNQDVNLTPKSITQYNSGKDIHIKKSKRGTFTKAAKQHGMSVQSFANKVLKNPSKYSTAMRKKANFAHNAASWKH